MRNSVAHACWLCNRAKDYCHAGASESTTTSAMDQGDRGKATAATETRPVDLDKLQIEGRTRDLAMFNLVIDTSQL